MSLRYEVKKDIQSRLSANGIDEEAEAEWIVSIALGVKRDQVNSKDLVTEAELEKINKIVSERLTGRPLWYCVGDTDFYGYTVKVDERVLIPRPETELLVENALKVLTAKESVLDLCTGSGAIAIALNKRSGAKVTATDISDGALTLASENAGINGAKVEFIKSDLFLGLNGRKFDVIVSNPPYVRTADIKGLQSEVKDFEPKLALDGGDDGLDFYRKIAKSAKNHLNEKGKLFLECGEGQAEEIVTLLTDFIKVEIIKDYENIDRRVKAVL